MKRQLIRVMGLAAALLLSTAPGCGGANPARRADTSDARSVLDRALTAWREGKPAHTLVSEDPPLEVSDYQWRNGLHLVKYQVQNEHAPAWTGETFRVTIWLEDVHSTQAAVTVQYNVTTLPLRVVRTGS